MIKAWNCIVSNDERLDKMMSDSLAIYDQALYYQRQKFFETKEQKKIKTYSYNELWNIVKNDSAYKDSGLDIGPKTYAIRQVANMWNSYIKARIAYKKNPKKFTGEPKLPKYLYKNKSFNLVQIDKSRFRKKDEANNSFCLPCSDYKIQIPKRIKLKDVRQVTIQKFYGKTKINIIYEEREVKKNEYDLNSCMGIDLGVNNLCAITANDKPFSYVINGRPLKSMNQFYNKKLAELKSKLDVCNKGQYTSKSIQRLNEKRHNKIMNYLHNTSRAIINLCLENKIENIIIGHNKQWKTGCNMSKANNQNFVQIPFNTLINQLQYKSQEYTDLYIAIVEESYTSKIDHLVFEDMKHQEQYLGKRTKRGQFKSSTGKVLNADINGAIGILRKGNAITDDQLLVLRDRGDVVSPVVLNPLTCKQNL